MTDDDCTACARPVRMMCYSSPTGGQCSQRCARLAERPVHGPEAPPADSVEVYDLAHAQPVAVLPDDGRREVAVNVVRRVADQLRARGVTAG